MNADCYFIKRGDFNDCAHAGGGRGAQDAWCDSCVAVYRSGTSTRFERGTGCGPYDAPSDPPEEPTS